MHLTLFLSLSLGLSLVSAVPQGVRSAPKPITTGNSTIPSNSTSPFNSTTTTTTTAPTGPVTAAPGTVLFPADKWMLANCSKEVMDLGLSEVKRWEAAGGDGALSAWFRIWNQREGSHGTDKALSLVEVLLNTWGLSSARCDLIQDSCDYSSLQCKDVKYPGIYVTLLSLSNMHRFYLNFYESLGTAAQAASDKMGGFVADFAPAKEEPDDVLVKMLLGMLDAVFGFGIGKIVGVLTTTFQNAVVSELVEPLLETVRSTANDAISEQVNSPGDELSQLDKQNNLASFITALSSQQQTALRNHINLLLSGQVTTLSKLRNSLTSGKFLSDRLTNKDLFSLKNELSDLYSGLLIGRAWAMNKHMQPLVLYTDAPCDSTRMPFMDFKKELDEATRICSVEGKTLWLVGFDEESESNWCDPTGLEAKPCWPFIQLPGIDKLGSWGLDKNLIAKSAWEGYANNGGKNGFTPQMEIGVAYDGMAPGMASIPVCEIKQAMDAFNKKNGPGAILCDYNGSS